MKIYTFTLCILTFCTALGLTSTALIAEHNDKTKDDQGRYYTKDGKLTYHVAKDSTVGWLVYNGYRRYHSECHVCHGPDGLGSTFGPALTKSLQDMNYEQFSEIVADGQQNVSVGDYKAMPGFAGNPNVMCYVEDIYVYLRARAEGAVDRGRPDKKESKTKAAKQTANDCMGF